MDLDKVKVVQPDRDVLDLLREYDQKGGVLDLVFLSLENGGLSESLHRLAATSTLFEAQSRIGHWADSRVAEDPSWRDKIFRIVVPAGYSPIGRQITVAEFLGPLYSNEAGFRKPAGSGLYDEEMKGFAYAFMEPPYRLRDAEQLFLFVKDVIFEGFPSDAQVWEWETCDL